jgi:hypothetical protein
MQLLGVNRCDESHNVRDVSENVRRDDETMLDRSVIVGSRAEIVIAAR